MSLPRHWTTVALSDLVDIYDYARIPLNKRQRLRFQGPYPYYGANGVVDWVNDYIFNGTFILVAEDGGHYGDPTKPVATKVDGRFWVNNHAHILRARDGVDPSYLAYALRTVNWMEYVGGSTRLKLTQSSLKTLPIPITSTSEQIRLAHRLDEALSLAQRAAGTLADARESVRSYRLSITASALSGELTRQWREDIGAPVWENVRLGDHIEELTYGSSAKSSKSGSTPVLRMGNIQNGKIDWKDLVYTSNKEEIEKFALNRGDVLFNRTNSAELVGKTALYDSDRQAIYAGYLIKISCRPDLSPAFLTHLLNGPEARSYFAEVRSDGVNQSNINATKLADLRFRMPSLIEQHRIVDQLEQKLSWSSEMHEHIRVSEALLDQLKVSVIARGFRGELTSLEPEDEDVQMLLARLAAETPEARAMRLEAERSSFVKRPATGMIGGGQRVPTGGEDKAGLLKDILIEFGGKASASDVWMESKLSIEQFYKLLREEIKMGQVQEGHEKGWLVVSDET